MFDNITGATVLQVMLIAVGMMFVGAVGGMIGGMYVYRVFIKPVKRAVESMNELMIKNHRIQPTALPRRAAAPMPRRVVVREEEHRVVTSTRIAPVTPQLQSQLQPQQAQPAQSHTVITSARKPSYRTPHPLAASPARDDDTDIRVRPSAPTMAATSVASMPIIPGAGVLPETTSSRPAISPSHTLPPESRWR